MTDAKTKLSARQRTAVSRRAALKGIGAAGLATAATQLAPGAVRAQVAGRRGLVRRLRQGSGLLICGHGATLALARRPA